MVKDAAIDALHRFRALLRTQGVSADRMVLFGSHAAGTAHRDSDIDVVVVSADFAGHGLLQRLDLMAGAIWETHAPIEATALTPEEWKNGQSVVVEFAAHGIEV